jgi:glyoxylase-like metal-dependent hydrolase (beta-lactamase superfamily II)
MTVGAERLGYAHLGQAHTDGAIYVFFPVSNVLMTGDALSGRHVSDSRLHGRRLARRADCVEQDAARAGER